MPTLEDALLIAVKAHKGQRDKAGETYILHPLRVMMQMDTEEERIVAILHDVAEDAKNWTIDGLKQEGFNERVVDAINYITRRKKEGQKEPYEEFIERVKNNPLAIKVKIADLKDNMEVTRLKKMTKKDIEKLKDYHRALQNLSMIKESF
jgi:(p)ppGpp synthase/HD superfamily hydrolase